LDWNHSLGKKVIYLDGKTAIHYLLKIHQKIMLKLKYVLVLFSLLQLSVTISMAQLPNANPGNFKLYPEVNDIQPNLPSPFIFDGKEYVLAMTKESEYAIMNVTLSNDRGICSQLIVDTLDFPDLGKTGLHDERKLMNTSAITGWSVDTITWLGQPGGLSHSGFMKDGEHIISLLVEDNRTIKALGFTHPQMAKPLFHVLNMMDNDLSINRWNMAKHQWGNIQSFFYNDQKVNVMAYDTKGGQLSIFNDGIQGAFHIKLWREPTEQEMNYLKQHYKHLTEEEFKNFVELLSFINIGEMQPQYIMRYGFYEGHTFWRAEPLAIAFIFGMLPVENMDKIFEHQLDQSLAINFVQ
jgi:hypothetical protein